jgi:ABC-type multidrug transport system fused ATPase/permease subunit
LDTPHSSVRAFAAVASGYWTAPGYRFFAWLLTASMVVLGVANVGIALWLNIWNRDFFNALEKRDLAQLFELLWILGAIVVSAGVAVAIQLHVKRRLQINWRAWLSNITVQRWLHSGRQYQLGLLAEEVDNPDGRIAEDIRVSTEYAVEFAQTILQCILQLITFLSVLWILSGSLPIKLGGFEFALPGYMVWAAVAYALIGSLVTYGLGRGLIHAGNVRQGREADFRSGLTRARARRRHRPDARRGRRAGAAARLTVRSAFGLACADERPRQPFAAHQLAGLSRPHRAADRRPAALPRQRDPARRPDADRAGLFQRPMGAVVADRQFPEIRRMAGVDRSRRSPA